MRNKLTGFLLAAVVSVCYGDSYSTLLQRYESQIKQQERQLRGLRKNLLRKEQEAKRWEQKAEQAKDKWTDAGLAVEKARQMVRVNQQRRIQSHTKAEAAQWTVVEHTTQMKSAEAETRFWVTELYKRQRTPRYFVNSDPATMHSSALIDQLNGFSQTIQILAEKAQEQETALRSEEFRWQNEERKQMVSLDRSRHQQQTIWLHWQEAIQKQQSLEQERNQLEQSAQALRVMLSELKEHREQTLALRADTPRTSAALRSIKGTLPWPADGRVTQNFGKQYSEKLQQLLISNGIRIQAETGKSVRTVQPGKVLFARPFQQYGQLVIIQHKNGLTSVYGELGETRVKEGDVLASLDQIGTVGASRSFYFELRRHEEPINPLAWLAPQNRSELSSRRKFQ